MRKPTGLDLAAVFERVTVSIMLNRSPDESMVSNAERIKAEITEQQKRQLFMQMDERFKAWTGESFIGFTTRRAALAEQEKGDA